MRQHSTGTFPDERTIGTAKPGDQRIADIIDLIEADHLHILRWQARLGELRRRPGTRVTGVTLTATWNTLAAMIDLHIRADEEICVLAVCGTGPQAWDLTSWHTTDAYRDIREMTGETSLQPPGSPLWWDLATAALAACARQRDGDEQDLLADFRRRADPALRRQLARQWRAYTEAQIRDRFAQAPPHVPTCQLRLGRPDIVPYLKDPAFAPLACTCRDCTRRLDQILPPRPGSTSAPAR